MTSVLEAGALRTTFAEGCLGAVCADGHEVWLGVQFLLRDRHWRTPLARWSAPAVQRGPGGWRLRAEGALEGWPQVSLAVTVEAEGDAAIVFTGEATMQADIEVNRLGLCLLHPLAAAGAAVEVVHDDGRKTVSTLPALVPPWPPFTAIGAITHRVAAGLDGIAEFEGESFELEDQRNNADASFKTYSRSNFMPRPYRLRAGEVVRQRVRLRLAGAPPVAAAAPLPMTHRARGPAPAEVRQSAMAVGIEIVEEDLAQAAERAGWLAPLRLEHLHLAISARAPVIDAGAVARLLRAAGATLRLDVLHADEANADAVLQAIASGLRADAAEPAAVAVFPTTPEAVSAARRAFPAARVGGGTADFFVQLNRAERLPVLDFLSFTVCPIVHHADDATVSRSHQSLPGMLRTLAARHAAVPVHLGPSLIAARRSPLGELAAPASGGERVALASSDTRDGTAFGAQWAAAHLAAAQAAGAAAATVSRLAYCAPGSPMARMLASRRSGG